MKYLIAVLGLVSMLAYADTTEQLQMYNDAGGIIAITTDVCEDQEAIKLGFTHRAYATEKDGKYHYGCWMRPDISDAPPSTNKMRILPVVNLYFDGSVYSFLQEQFRPPPSHKNPEPGEVWI